MNFGHMLKTALQAILRSKVRSALTCLGLVVDAQPSVLARKAALQMAGGTSYLAATNGSAAVSVAPGAVLTVDLAPGANQKESTIGVFNYGPAKAIAGTGIVKVNGGTFFAWADEQAVETPDEFACGAKEAMMTGETPETLRYVEDCDVKPCVLVGPGVTVTVKDIPHVTGFTVSNAVEAINGGRVPGGTEYRVVLGDDVFVGYTVEAGYSSQSPNPLVYPAIEAGVTVDGNTIPTVLSVPYRAWNETTRQMEDKVCTDYTIVTNETMNFENGRWYVVTGEVSRAWIGVQGSAHLILCDGAKLTVRSEMDSAGIRVMSQDSLFIYGQREGTGELEATGGAFAAGIGNAVYGLDKVGSVTINGGRVTATGGIGAAGIGGGAGKDGGTVTINGGRVVAEGGLCAAGIGGGSAGRHPCSGGSVTINGGTVHVLGEDFGLYRSRLTIDGGSVQAMRIAQGLAKNSTPTNVYCVTVKCEGIRDQGSGIRLEGLEGYGTNDIYAVEGKVYLWLPNGTHHFTLSDGTTTHRYCAVVKGVAITVEPLVPVGFFVNGVDIGKEGTGTGWVYMGKNLTLNGAGPYVLSGVATNDEVHIHVISPNAATVILSNAVVFASENPPALNVDQNTSLLMAGGTSCIAATNDIAAVSVGADAALTVGLAPGADEAESMICVFNYGNRAAVDGAGSVAVNGGTLAVWADRQSSAAPLTRAADVFCMLAGDTPETAKVVDQYNGEAYVLVTAAIAPVTLDKPVGPFDTPEAASNAMAKAVFMPSAAVESKLGEGSPALGTYCDMFGFAVTGGGGAWSVKAALYPEAWTNVTESASQATRQIPLADIAALPLDTPTNVTAKGCGVPGFYYSFYSGGAVTNLRALAAEGGRNVLCGADKEVKFDGVVKPSDAAGFFSIGVKEAPGVMPSDGYRRLPIIIPPVMPE